MNNAVYEELDEAKAELENLRQQYRANLEFSERLKRSHDDLLTKNKETNSMLEKLARDLNDKDDEISATKQMYDDVKSKLTEKESIINHLTYAHDKFRSDFTEKLRKCEEENKALALFLDDANAKNNDSEKQIHALKQEIQGVKRVLAVSENKCSEIENLSKISKEGREDVYLRLDDENRKIEDQLKWKKEQFGHLEEAYKKLQNEFKMKENEWEKERNVILDDANARGVDQEKQILALKQELEGFKRVLAISEQKSSKMENSLVEHSKGGKEEDVWLRLDEEKRKFEDQLKWKKEQFCHLEEAHKKLLNEFKMKENERLKEKNAFIDDMSSLQMNLESQVRISQDLQGRLEMCNGALAHAESKKKLLEAQLLESRTNLDSVCGQYEEAKSNFENLVTKRDQEMANLRSSLGTKEILYKEMEYQFKKLEQEKQDLLVTIKELQEEKIHEARIISSSSKLQNKLKSLESAHKECSVNLKARECEWRSEMEKITGELNFCREELKSKDLSLNNLKLELEGCDSLMMTLELINQETSLMLLILNSEFSEVRHGISRSHACMTKKICGLVEELEKKKNALKGVQNDLEEERGKVVILARKVETLEEIQLTLQKELERLKVMLNESSACQVQLIRSDLEKVNEELDRANEELYEKYCEVNEIEFELQIWKSMAEKMEANLKQNLRMRKEVEASLLAQMEVEMNLKQEKESLGHLLEEKTERINNLEQQLVEANENTKEVAEIARSHQNSKSPNKEIVFPTLLEEKEERICGLKQLVTSLEDEFESSTGSFSSKLLQMQKEIKFFQEKVKEAEVLKEMEIQEKDMMILELENDLCNLQQRVECKEKAISDSEMNMRKIHSELEKMLHDRIESVEDIKLMRGLEKIVETINCKEPREVDVDSDEEEDFVKENMGIFFSSPSLMKKAEGGGIHEERRLPFRSINN